MVEFGAYQGGNAVSMARVMREVDPDSGVFALDTFEGMPNTDKQIDAHILGTLPTLWQRISDSLTNMRSKTCSSRLFRDSSDDPIWPCAYRLRHLFSSVLCARRSLALYV